MRVRSGLLTALPLPLPLPLLLVLAATAPCLAGTSADLKAGREFLPIDTIDIQKLESIPPHSIVHNAFWPSDETVQSRMYKGDLSSEKAELVKILRRLLKKECLPTEDQVQRDAVGITNLRNESDFLLLHYKTAAGYDIRVMDERVLCLMVTVPNRSRKPLAEVGPFVWQTIASIVSFPEFEGQRPQKPEVIALGMGSPDVSRNRKQPPYVPVLTVSPRDIGKSRTGECLYGPRVPTGDDWYSRIFWWSDGKRVLFAVSKLTKEEFEAQKTMSRPQPIPPRVFKSRMPK